MAVQTVTGIKGYTNKMKASVELTEHCGFESSKSLLPLTLKHCFLNCVF